MQFWLGSFVFVAGAVLWYVSRREAVIVPPWMPRLGIAVTSLGLSTLAATQPTVAWKISSICFSLVAIILLISVIKENLRRR
ncbi:MAG: hypothetical protein H7Z74_06335 [Anaerolineae bacterium]|nr:hypothetical protein [Gemmatimonadaceae bacterium]